MCIFISQVFGNCRTKIKIVWKAKLKSFRATPMVENNIVR